MTHYECQHSPPAQYLQETGESLGEEDQRSVAELLIDQVEFADVILISKTDLVTADDIKRLTAILNTLNTNARVIPIVQGQVDIDAVLSTGSFDFERAQQAPGWLKEMRGEHVPETEEYGISSFSYEARRPFHPEKFYQFLHNTRCALTMVNILPIKKARGYDPPGFLCTARL